jgi:hypothetical protein
MSNLFLLAKGLAQGTDVSGVDASASIRAASSADRANRSVKMLEESLAKSLLICEALWELLSERSGLTIDDLHKKLYEIDMRDGQLDGKNQRKAIECNQCHRMVGPKHSVCIYCGYVVDDSVFRL